MAYNKEIELNGVVIATKLTNTTNDRTQRAEYIHKKCGNKRQYKNFCSECNEIVPKEQIEAKKDEKLLEAELNANKRLITAKPIPIDTYFNGSKPRAYSIYEVLGKAETDNLQLSVITEYLSANGLILPLAPFSLVKGIERQAYLYADQNKLFLNITRRPSETTELTPAIKTEVSKDMLQAVATFFNSDLIVWENKDIYTENNLIRQPQIRQRQNAVNPLLAKLTQLQTPSKETEVITK